ncbi:integrase, catalytic region, zinc finger, CCHC-type containing protein [Tanacetum coccineum]
MSDNIPYEIQHEIIKKVSDVKSLIRFRSVSKRWRSFIDSSEFIAGYGARDTQPQSLLLRYDDNSSEEKYVCFLDDENDPLTQQQQQDFAPNVTDTMKQFNDLKIIGSSHGLLCLHSYDKDMYVLWNPSIRKSLSIKIPLVPFKHGFLGFAIVIDNCIYWAAREFIRSMDGSFRDSYMIMSFDLIAKDIRLVDIPLSCILSNPFPIHFFISKLRESLVLFVPNERVEIPVCGVTTQTRSGE